MNWKQWREERDSRPVPLRKGSYRAATPSCNRGDCEGEPVGDTRMCANHIEMLTGEGWTVKPTGSMRRGDVSVSPNGVVKVTANYNPRMIGIMTGEISIEDLDDEELARGMCRNENGLFPRAEAVMVPKAMFDKMTRELFARSDAALRDGLMDAVNSLIDITKNSEVDAGTRLRAGQWLFERLRGKVPDVVQITQEKPFEQVLTHIHRGPRVVEAEPEVEEEFEAPAVDPAPRPKKYNPMSQELGGDKLRSNLKEARRRHRPDPRSPI